MPRFVLLLHECPNGIPRSTHCDLMLETDESLETWALGQLPSDWHSLSTPKDSIQLASTNSVAAERIAEHRKAYLDYEGPVSGERGNVRKLDAGSFCNCQTPFSYELKGQKIKGKIELRQTTDAHQWQLKFTPAQS